MSFGEWRMLIILKGSKSYNRILQMNDGKYQEYVLNLRKTKKKRLQFVIKEQ